MSYSGDNSTAATTRLRTLQSSPSIVTTAFVTPSSSEHNHLVASHIEMAKRTEVEPLLSSPSHETHYTSDKLNEGASSSVHLDIEGDKNEEIMQVNHVNEDGDSLQSYREEENHSLLIADRPVVVRTYVHNVFFLNSLALLFVSFNMTLNLTVLAIIHERIPMNEPHLPDIAFDILPDHRSYLDFAEYFIVFQMSCLFLLLFFHKHRSIILRRVCIIMGIIYFFRAICMAATQLPLASRNYQCSPQLKNSSETANLTSFEFVETIASRVFYMSLGMGLSINGHHSYCGDYIFSGHTVILMLTYLTFQEYLLPSRRRTIFWKIIYIMELLLTIISVICILIARGHYLIDIVLAYFVTTRIFYIYHTLCIMSNSNLKSNASYFNGLWWWPIFVYFENVNGKYSLHTSNYSSNHNPNKNEDLNQVQRAFEWPLPWPRRFLRRKHRTQFMA